MMKKSSPRKLRKKLVITIEAVSLSDLVYRVAKTHKAVRQIGRNPRHRSVQVIPSSRIAFGI
jgi:hypothetical protein